MQHASLDELRAELARLASAVEAIGADRAQLVADRDQLAAEHQRLAAEHQQLLAEREQYQALYLKTLEQCRKLELGLLGQKAERLPANEAQLSMGVLAELLGRAPSAEPAPPPASQIVREHTRVKPTGRKPLPEHLPRVVIELVPDVVQAEGRDAFDVIGVEESEVIEWRSASAVAVVVRRLKYVRKDRERAAPTTVYIAEPPTMPIQRGLAGPGLLADTVVRRWQDHQPLHRMEDIYARDGLEIARSTMCGWHESLAHLARPLLSAMWTDARGAPYLCTDATGVLVQAREKCRNGHFWVVVVPERHVLYAYSARHDGAAVDAMLADYQGYLVADAHAVYDHLFKSGKVVEVACWAHARRYFWKALDSEPARARAALALIGEIFRIERATAEQSSPRVSASSCAIVTLARS